MSEPLVDHYNMLMGIAVKVANGDRQRAEDLRQDVALKMWAKNSTYAGEASGYKNLLWTVARNEQINQYRADGRKPWLDDVDDVVTQSHAVTTSEADTMSSDERYLMDYYGPEVRKAVAGIDPMFVQAVILKDVEGYRYQEIADIMGIKASTVPNRVKRGRDRLRVALQDYAEQEGYA